MTGRAFKILSGENEGKIMTLTHREFNRIFDSVHPRVGQKALAWSEFVLDGQSMIQVDPATT